MLGLRGVFPLCAALQLLATGCQPCLDTCPRGIEVVLRESDRGALAPGTYEVYVAPGDGFSGAGGSCVVDQTDATCSSSQEGAGFTLGAVSTASSAGASQLRLQLTGVTPAAIVLDLTHDSAALLAEEAVEIGYDSGADYCGDDCGWGLAEIAFSR